MQGRDGLLRLRNGMTWQHNYCVPVKGPSRRHNRSKQPYHAISIAVGKSILPIKSSKIQPLGLTFKMMLTLLFRRQMWPDTVKDFPVAFPHKNQLAFHALDWGVIGCADDCQLVWLPPAPQNLHRLLPFSSMSPLGKILAKVAPLQDWLCRQ